MNDTLERLRVLVVEDESALADREVEWLRSQGAVAESVATATDALNEANKGNWDVVLLDLCLPDCSGQETVRRFREQYPKLPVVVLTGTDDPKVGLAVLLEGAQDFMRKGIRMGEIGLSLIKSLTRHKVRGRFERMEEIVERMDHNLDQLDTCIKCEFSNRNTVRIDPKDTLKGPHNP